MADGYIITPEDQRKLNSLLTKEGRRRYGDSPGFGGPTPDDEEDSGAELYVARTPFAGISGLGFGANTGTGTTGATDDQPGHAECYLWRVLRPSPGVFQMDPIDIYPKDVLNLSTSAIPGDTWILAARDKFGEWFAATGGTGLEVCGNPYRQPTTDANSTHCPVYIDFEQLFSNLTGLKFNRDDFQVKFNSAGACGDEAVGTGTGAAAETGTGAIGQTQMGRIVEIILQGFTGTIRAVYDVYFCASDCTVKKRFIYICVSNGRVTGYYLDPATALDCP